MGRKKDAAIKPRREKVDHSILYGGQRIAFSARRQRRNLLQLRSPELNWDLEKNGAGSPREGHRSTLFIKTKEEGSSNLHAKVCRSNWGEKNREITSLGGKRAFSRAGHRSCFDGPD